MNLITNESHPAKTEISTKRLRDLLTIERNFDAKLEELLEEEHERLWEENQLLRGSNQLYRVFSSILMLIILGLCVNLFLINP